MSISGTAGLLSLPGASLAGSGVLFGAVGTPLFSTNTLLDLASPQPETGTVCVPVLEEAGLGVAPLSRRNAEGFQRLVSGLFQDGERIATSQGRWGLAAPYAISATDGRWFIFDWEKKDGNRHLSLKSLDGRLFAMDFLKDGRVTVETGWFRGFQASALQRVSLDPDGEVSTAGYSIEFYNGGVVSLGTYFGLHEITVSEIVRELRRKTASPVRTTYHGDPNGGHLRLDLDRPVSYSLPLMPLDSNLQGIWEGALHHLYSYPY